MRTMKLPGLWACAGLGLNYGTWAGVEFGLIVLPKPPSPDPRDVTRGLVRLDVSIGRRVCVTVMFGRGRPHVLAGWQHFL